MIECTPFIFRRYRPFTPIEKTNIAAQRNRRDTVFCFIGTAHPTPDRLAESDREAQHFHPRPASDDVMPVLVDSDENADRDDEGEQICQSITHGKSFLSS